MIVLYTRARVGNKTKLYFLIAFARVSSLFAYITSRVILPSSCNYDNKKTLYYYGQGILNVIGFRSSKYTRRKGYLFGSKVISFHTHLYIFIYKYIYSVYVMQIKVLELYSATRASKRFITAGYKYFRVSVSEHAMSGGRIAISVYLMCNYRILPHFSGIIFYR